MENPKIFLSVDTRKSEIMLKAIENKSDIINDVSGFNYDINAIEKIKNRTLAYPCIENIKKERWARPDNCVKHRIFPRA